MRASAVPTPLSRPKNMRTPNYVDVIIPTTVEPIAPSIRPRAIGNNEDGVDDDGAHTPTTSPPLSDNGGNVDDADKVPTEWKGCHGDHMLARLRSIGPINYGQNDKEFFKSYKIWKSLTAQQKDKAYSWFKKLALPFRSNFLFFIFFV